MAEGQCGKRNGWLHAVFWKQNQAYGLCASGLAGRQAARALSFAVSCRVQLGCRAASTCCCWDAVILPVRLSTSSHLQPQLLCIHNGGRRLRSRGRGAREQRVLSHQSPCMGNQCAQQRDEEPLTQSQVVCTGRPAHPDSTTHPANMPSQCAAASLTLGICSKGPSTNGSTSGLFHTGWPDSVAATLHAASVACGGRGGPG